MSVLNGARCDAAVTRGCRCAVYQQAVSSLPVAVIVSDHTGSVYVTQMGSMSIFKAARR